MQDINLYTPEGWLDMSAPAKTGAWLIVYVGARQVGKTYGTLKFLFDTDAHVLYLRRTREELEAISTTDDLNPFLPLQAEGYDVDLFKTSQNTWMIGDVDTEADTKKAKDSRGVAMPLNYIAKMRGFNGGRFTDIVLDEFIPERAIRRGKNESDTILNLYTTVNGNRELEGKPPIRFWLLANAFDLLDPVLLAYGLQTDFERMERRGDEYTLLKGGAFLALPHSSVIVSKRAETAQNAFLRRKGAGGKFLAMSLDNTFAYSKSELIKPRSIKGHTPLIRAGSLYIYTNNTSMYVCRSAGRCRWQFEDTPEGHIKAGLQCPEIRVAYNQGIVKFASADVLGEFKGFFGIKD